MMIISFFKQFIQIINSQPKTIKIAGAVSLLLICVLITFLLFTNKTPSANADATVFMNTQLASELLVPPENSHTYPFVFDQRIVYTKKDAEYFRPNLGNIDISNIDFIRRAELEVIYGAIK